MSEDQRLRLLEMIKAAKAAPPASTAEARAQYDAMGDLIPLPATLQIEGGQLGGVAVEFGLDAAAAADGHLVYFHGGGYTVGSIASHRGLVALLGRAAGARTISVGYRLAPEHPYPAAVEDGLAVYRALLADGIPAANIAMAGDSAGGALVAALLVAARREGLPLPAAVAMFSPLLDMTGDAPAYVDRASTDAMITREALVAMRGGFLGTLDPADPSVSPVYADLAGLPPILIHVGTSEVLIDDALGFARKAMIANVAVTVEAWPHQQHVWQLYASILDEGAQSIERAGRFLAEQLADRSAIQGV
jgi:acetyl esterase/lipase